MKVVKTLSIVIFLVLALAIGAGIYLYSNLNAIIKEAVETVGPEVTKTSVNLEAVDVKPTEGSGQFTNFSIGNPSGYSDKKLFNLENLLLKFDPKTALEDVIVINDIVVEGMKINVEEKSLKSNLQALLDNLQSDETTSSSESESTSSGPDKKFIVENIVFSDNGITLSTEKYGEYNVDFPSFSLADIGKKENGLTPQELGVAIVKPLLKKAEDAVKDKIEGLAKEELEAKLKEKKQELENRLDEKKDELESKVDNKKNEVKDDVENKKDDLERKVKDKVGEEAGEKLKSLFK